MVRVKITDTTVIQIITPDGPVNVLRVCYQHEEVGDRCVWIDAREATDENIRETIRKDIERARSGVTGWLEL